MPRKQAPKTDRQSKNGAQRGVKKNGAGRNNWGIAGDELAPIALDRNDPNYDSGNE